MKKKLSALVAGLALAVSTSAQLVPGYNVVLGGNVSVMDMGGRPVLVVAWVDGGMGYPKGPTMVQCLDPWGTNWRTVQLSPVAAAAFDPRPCAPGGSVRLHVQGDFGGAVPYWPVPIDSTGYGFATWPTNWDTALRYDYFGKPYMVYMFGFDYEILQTMNSISASPCGGFANPGPRVVAFDVRLK